MADGSAVTIAVDTNGADLGPAEVAAGAATAAAQGVRVLLFGPAEAIGDVADGVEVVDAPVSIAKAADPVIAVRSTPDASIVQAAQAVAEGRAQALVAGGSTGSALAASLFNIRRASGIFRPALAIPLPVSRNTKPAQLPVARFSWSVPFAESRRKKPNRFPFETLCSNVPCASGESP